MVAPPIVGLWIDSRTGIPAVFTVLGSLLGLGLGLAHLMALGRDRRPR